MKETFRTGVFETNSSTMHTLSLVLNDEFTKNVDYNDKDYALTTMDPYGEWMGHFIMTAKDKMRFILTDGINKCRREDIIIPVMEAVISRYNKKHKTKYYIDIDSFKTDEVKEEWEYFGDGNAAEFIAYDQIKEDMYGGEAFNFTKYLDEESKKPHKHAYKDGMDDFYDDCEDYEDYDEVTVLHENSISMWIGDRKDDPFIKNIDEIFEIIDNDKLFIYTYRT